MQQFLRNTNVIPGIVFSAGDADSTVTVTVTTEKGVQIASGSATHQAGPTDPEGFYTFQLAPQTQLNRLTVAWSGTWAATAQTVRTYVEITGGRLFSVGEARAYRDQQLADTDQYSDDAIREAHDRIADDFQNACGTPFFPRYEHEFLSADRRGVGTLWLPWKRPLSLISMTVNGTVLSAPELAEIVLESTGRMSRTAGWSFSLAPNTVEVEWERGYQYPPEPIKRAALALAHYELVSSEITDRMVSFANDLGTVRLSTPGPNAPTGIPLVDATLTRYDERDFPMVAIR